MSDGEQLIDEFRLINCIASGNASQVWEVAEEGTNAHFAMKLLLPDALKDAEQKKILKHEAGVAKALDHPNFVKFHRVSVTRDHAYILMDYFRAPSLKPQISVDRIGLHLRLRRLIEQLSVALGYMHDRGWLHRDIKPENVLFNKGSELRLIDFSLASRHATGLSKLFSGGSKTIQGTRTYIAPETIRKQPPTPQTDIYSLGVTIYEVITGGPPFTGTSPNDLLKKHLATLPIPPSVVNTNVTPEMDRFVLRMLAKKPADRHKSMAEIYSELRAIKIFKEDVQELEEQRQKKDQAALQEGLASVGRLDSRADHQRSTALGTTASTTPRPSPPAPAQPPQKPAARPGQPAATGQPAAGQGGRPAPPAGYPPAGAPFPFPPGQGPPQHMPGAPMPYPYQGQPYPGYFPPGYPQPGYPPQGYPQPAPQGMPPHAPAPMPGAPAPAANHPLPGPPEPQQRPVVEPAAKTPGAPPPPQPAKPPADKPAPPPEPNPDDLPLMDELPPVI